MNLVSTDSTSKARSTQSGSALIISIIFSTVIIFGLASLLPMILNDWKSNARASAQEVAFSLAESGIEEAIWAVKEYADTDQHWIDAGWSEDSVNQQFWYKEWSLADITASIGESYDLDESRTGSFRVIVQKTGNSRVSIISQGIVRGGANVTSDFEVARIIETEFRRPNPFGYGLIARDALDFNGRPFFDSYDSREFPYNYAFGINSGDEVTVGSVSDNTVKLDLGNSSIYGDLATGSEYEAVDPRSGSTVTGDMIWEFDMDFPIVEKPAGYLSWPSP